MNWKDRKVAVEFGAVSREDYAGDSQRPDGLTDDISL